MKESILYKKLENKKVQCQTCNHCCLLSPNQIGICGVRKNIEGRLFVLNYGRIIAAHLDPIEKKPLYHFLPKTFSYSIACAGCNFRCSWCQNFDISQISKEQGFEMIADQIGEPATPENIIKEALKNGAQSISYTYTEPTIFLEFALETMKLAHQKGLKNVWVSNGYMTPQALKLILPYLDAVNIDLKAWDEKIHLKYCGANISPILKNIKTLFENKIHIEITTLIIPGINDDEKQLGEIAGFIASISSEIPWHISRFFPTYKMLGTPVTPIATLELAEKIGKKAGLKYIYKGNI